MNFIFRPKGPSHDVLVAIGQYFKIPPNLKFKIVLSPIILDKEYLPYIHSSKI